MGVGKRIQGGGGRWWFVIVGLIGLILGSGGCGEVVAPSPCFFPHSLGDKNAQFPEEGYHQVLRVSPKGHQIGFIVHRQHAYYGLRSLDPVSLQWDDGRMDAAIRALGFSIGDILSMYWVPYSDRYVLVEAETVVDTNRWGTFGRNYFLVDRQQGKAYRIAPSGYSTAFSVDETLRFYRWMEQSEPGKNFLDAGEKGMYYLEGDEFLPFENDPVERWRRQVMGEGQWDRRWWQEVSPDGEKVFLAVELSGRYGGYAYYVNGYRLWFERRARYPIIVRRARWSPDGKRLALVVMPVPPRLFPQIWIWDDVDRLLRERPVVAKPDRVVDLWQTACGYRFLPGGDFLSNDRLVVTMVPPRDTLPFAYGYLYEVDLQGQIIRQLTMIPLPFK